MARASQITVKSDEETYERFRELRNRLKVSGLTEVDEDVIKLLMDAFDNNELSSQLEYGASFKELNQLISRISELFANQARHNETNKTTLEREFEQKLTVLQEKLDSALEKKSVLEQEVANVRELNKDFSEANAEQNRLIEEMEQRIVEQKEAMALLKQQFDVNNNLIAEQVQEIQHMKEKVILVEDLKERNSDLEGLLEEKEKIHAAQVERIKFEQEKALFEQRNKLQQDFNEELLTYRREKDKAISEYNNRIGKLQDKYQSTFEQLKELETDYNLKVNQYEATIKNLEIELKNQD